MNSQDLSFLRQLVKERSGIILTDDKAYLFENRLNPLAFRRGLDGIPALVNKLRRDSRDPLGDEIVEAMTTNESLFFRDTRPFEMLRTHVLPDLMERNKSRKIIRIWNAACSSGQEPYSVAITLHEMGIDISAWRIDIVATDLSSDMIKKAKNGIYSQFEVQRGLPIKILLKYFTKIGSDWQIKPELRKMVQFRRHNLFDDYRPLGCFDIIFCRNVLIYFDSQARGQILDRMAAVLAPDGVLFLGGTETVIGITDRFQPVAGLRGIYRGVDDPGARSPRPRPVSAAGSSAA